MSSILKALKKLEEEKTLRPNGRVDVAKGILRGVPQNRKSRWLLPLSVVGAASGAALLTYLAVGLKSSDDADRHAVRSPQVRTESGRAGVSNDAAVPVSRGKTPSGVEKTTAPPAVAWAGAKNRSGSEVAAKPVPGKSPELPTVSKKEELSGRVPPPAERIREPAEYVPAPMQTSSAQPAPGLKVTGIAWQKGSSDRLAVVNGLSVTEGMTVDGVRVEEIFQDKVRFSFQNRFFDVAVGKEMQYNVP